MNKLNKLLNQIKSTPESIEFADVINTIDEYYLYRPTQFSNGENNNRVINQAGDNEGSCKIFSFAQIQALDKNQTLNCFGKYYRSDVLKHPENTDHANIRSFIKYGWQGIKFEKTALSLK